MSFNISLDLYKIFCSVVRNGNMSMAARELYISQPAISMAIRQLETKLGKTLLIRSPKGIRTTADGAVMYGYLNQALELIQIAERKFTETAKSETGEIKIGAGDMAIARFLMPYIEEYLLKYSDINIRVLNRMAFETIKLLKNKLVDIAFVNLPIDEDERLDITECTRVHDCVVGGSKYAPLREIGIKFKNLPEYPLLLLEPENDSRRFLDDYAAKKNITLNPAAELDSNDLLLKFAAANLGLAVVTREFYKDEINNADLFEIPVSPRFPPRAIGLLKLKDIPLSHAAEQFIRSIK